MILFIALMNLEALEPGIPYLLDRQKIGIGQSMVVVGR